MKEIKIENKAEQDVQVEMSYGVEVDDKVVFGNYIPAYSAEKGLSALLKKSGAKVETIELLVPIPTIDTFPEAVIPERCPQCLHGRHRALFSDPLKFKCRRCGCIWDEEEYYYEGGVRKTKYRTKIVKKGYKMNEYLVKEAAVIRCTPEDLFPKDADLDSIVTTIRRGTPLYVGGVCHKVGKLRPGDVIKLMVYETKDIGSEKWALGEVVEKGGELTDGSCFLIYFNGGALPRLYRN